MNIKRVSEDFLKTNIINISTVDGGDINEAFSLQTDSGIYFLKVNEVKNFPEMFLKEKNGLEALSKKSTFRIPKVLDVTESDNKQFLFMEYIQEGRQSSNFWENFGRKLAEMHSQTSENFGWETDNYMGNLKQQNNWTASFQDFFANYRILPLVEMLYQRNSFSKTTVQSAESLCLRINEIFPNESPGFIHGDLWSGNFMTDETGNPVLIDPAVSFSHREMDIGMTKLFGGFSEQFYDSYNENYPLENGWKERLPLSQLYPLLIHAVIFGGSYVSNCRNIIEKF